MKILIVHPKLIWRGAEKLSVNFAVNLQKLGHRVSYLTLFVDDKGKSEDIKKLHLILPSRFWQKVITKNEFTLSFFGFWTLLVMTLKYAKKCQIINAQNFPAPWVAVIAGKIFGKPVIWTLYDVPQKISWKKRNSLVEYLIWFFAASVIDKLLVSQIDEIIVQGNFEYKKVLKRYGRKSKIIMPVINERFFIGSKKPFRLGVNLSGKYIMVSASHLHFRKNQKIIIKAFKKVESKIKEPLLVFAGDGPDKYKLIDLVKRLSLTDKVIFTGILSEKEMSELYSKSKLLLLPSLEEPYGLTPFEALLSGVCPIVSDRAGCSEVIRKYNLGYVVKPIVSNFAGTILKAYKNKKEVLADINRGKLWIKKNMAPIRYAKEHELIFRKYV